ncbi:MULTISPECIES: VWA domain-containing protein [Catenuloplanes]|uniref:Mg-protoporphyrin IX chelatase n=1 Tax=Catenuloplanes niger TaxID=587534 RepID=A0AAE3ZVT2_9ACTN|nr:VWA domain-containing protein [Catenuloplanes niger]MDR7326731.1 magnesium chelatase subunit D [Catenuloplanes niger]
MTTPYPFSAVVGLDDLRQALLLTAVSPAIGGVLVRGEKGTAKSTVVRALAALLPSIDVVAGCRFACDPAAPDPSCPDGPHTLAPGAVDSRRAPLVELPVGATEDRVVGTLDLQRALADGTKAYEPGLLAAAHRGALYVDEVNLLPDHLVDLLLDAAAMGRAHVERDGVSVKHAARFLLVGTMNPEEGEPRPQLVDRFGLVVTVVAPREAGARAEVVRRRLAYEADPDGFAVRWTADERDLADRIVAARALLPSVTLPDAELDRIARICIAYAVDGMRADIVVARAAIALAAWDGRTVVTGDDVRAAARLALPHRRRRDPLDPPGADEEKLEEALNEAGADPEPPAGPTDDGDPSDGDPSDGDPDGGPDGGGPSGGPLGGPDGAGAPPSSAPAPATNGSPDAAPPPGDGTERTAARPAPVGAAFRPKAFTVTGRGEGAHAGRRSPAFARRGRVIGARTPIGRRGFAPHLPATVRAAAERGSRTVEAVDLREAVHVGREANLVLFVVDASGSMAARQRMRTVKTAVLSLLRDAYQRRDRIGMITFRGGEASTVLPPTSSHEVGVARLAELRTGGRTPLAAGLRSAATVIAAERRRDPRRRPLLVVVTDGRATSGPDPLTVTPALAGTSAVVVDCESGPVRLGLARRLAGALAADWMPLDQLSASAISVRTV